MEYKNNFNKEGIWSIPPSPKGKGFPGQFYMKKYTINVHYDAVVSVEVIAENEEQAKELALNKADATPLTDADVVGSNPCIADVEELTPIMNTSNNHDEELVRRINKSYYTNKRDFENIVALLMIRDKVECEEKNVNDDTHTYLMNVADDTDLECILNFVRVD